MSKKIVDPNLIHCCHCGKTLARRNGKTDSIIIRCDNCGTDIKISVNSIGRATVSEA